MQVYGLYGYGFGVGLTSEVHARVEDIEGVPVADDVTEGVHGQRHVAADVVDDEEEDGDGGGLDVGLHQLHDDGQHHTEPHLRYTANMAQPGQLRLVMSECRGQPV